MTTKNILRAALISSAALLICVAANGQKKHLNNCHEESQKNNKNQK